MGRTSKIFLANSQINEIVWTTGISSQPGQGRKTYASCLHHLLTPPSCPSPEQRADVSTCFLWRHLWQPIHTPHTLPDLLHAPPSNHSFTFLFFDFPSLRADYIRFTATNRVRRIRRQAELFRVFYVEPPFLSNSWDSLFESPFVCVFDIAPLLFSFVFFFHLLKSRSFHLIALNFCLTFPLHIRLFSVPPFLAQNPPPPPQLSGASIYEGLRLNTSCRSSTCCCCSKEAPPRDTDDREAVTSYHSTNRLLLLME